MQKPFVLKAKTAIRRVAAISTTAAMLGATVFGGVAAADLGDYPSPFVMGGEWKGVIVVGSDAATGDVIGATEIAGTLAQAATKPASSTGGVSVTGGVSKEIVLGEWLGNSTTGGFDAALDDDDISSLADSSLTFASTSYDFSEKLVFHQNGPQVVTSLAVSDDDYKDSIGLEMPKGKFGYYYVFDSTINVTTATSAQPLSMTFLGRNIKVTSATATGITARVGQEFFINVGDVVEVNGKKVTLRNVASGTSPSTAILDVDGVTETLSGSTAETVNGLEIQLTDTFYADATTERAANLVIGKEAVETYNDGDKFFEPCATKYVRDGCNKDTPDWVWNIDDLGNNARGDTATSSEVGDTAGPTIGVINEYTVDDFSDGAAVPGDVYDLPLGGYEIQFDSLTVPDTDYMTLTVKFENNDMSRAAGYTTQTSEPSWLMEASGVKEGLQAYDGTNYVKTNKIWISMNDSNASTMDVFYRDTSNGRVTLARTYDPAAETQGVGSILGRVDYGDTKSSNVVVLLRNGTSTMGADSYNITLDVRDDNSYIADGVDDIDINLGHTTTDFADQLGATADTEEASEVQYGSSDTTLGTKDEDHRTRYGVIIKNPKSNGASDKVVLSVPDDSVRANVIVAGPTTTVAATAGGPVTVSSVSTVPLAKLDTDITDKTAQPVILVGGPLVNRLTAEALGVTYGDFAAAQTVIPEDAGILQLVDNAFGGTNMALVVAGWNAGNTRAAANVLKDYTAYAADLTGTEVQVSGTGTSISLGPVTISSGEEVAADADADADADAGAEA